MLIHQKLCLILIYSMHRYMSLLGQNMYLWVTITQDVLKLTCQNGQIMDVSLIIPFSRKLTINAPIATNIVCFSRLLKC